ncbi:MAG: DUF2937 family protein [Hyphomicrobiales bacterium]
MFGRLIILIFGLFGASGLAQGPEMATQYEQRIGGALGELQTVIEQFDKDVAKHGLTRETALETYSQASAPFLKDRGRSMQIALSRFDTLTHQVKTFKTSNDLYKPIYLFAEGDEKVMQGMLKDYTFGIPATLSGFVYAVFGFFFGGFFGWVIRIFSPRDAGHGDVRVTK